ncbi:hypothetical protein [Nostoc sp. CALU 1950]|uniref:hypothetical protein n=1 Tax=Nostoc sp. CALU 1950 TaxID=3104321 RepID=UPI003EBD137B
MVTNTSTIDELIRNQNPFAGHIVVRPQQIWGKSFPDVPSINAHASDAVFEAIEKIRQGQRETVGITIASEKGAGKSHIISRIRHRLLVEDGSLFIYMSKYDNLNQIKSQFLQSVASSLRAFGSQKVMQWQEIAAALINEAKSWEYTPQQYISQYPNWFSKYSNKFLEQLTELILLIKPQITNPYIVKAILWTLSTAHANYANYWLSGLELTQAQADAMGLPNPKNEYREAEALNTVRQIIDLTSDYRIPVICFDELDNLEITESGFTTVQVIADLVKDMYNSLKRGVFLLTMYRETWEEQIKLLPQAEAVMDRLVSNQVERRPIRLNFLNPDDVISIVRQWLQEFYQENQQTPPHSLYPFDENKLRELGRERPTVRSVLKWCADNFVPNEDIIDDPMKLGKINTATIATRTYTTIHPVKPYFNSELENVQYSIDSLIEEEATIVDALWLGFNSLIGETIEGITIESIEEVEPSSANNGFMDFKIIGNCRKVRIGVDVVQQDYNVIGAALGRLIDYKTFDLTRGCLVRSKKISSKAVLARERLKILLNEKGGEWVGLQSQDIKPLLAVLFVYYNRESYELTEEQIFEFIDQKKLAINNPLIREILSDPSGQEPTNLSDDGLPISIPQPIANADNIDLNI